MNFGGPSFRHWRSSPCPMVAWVITTCDPGAARLSARGRVGRHVHPRRQGRRGDQGAGRRERAAQGHGRPARGAAEGAGAHRHRPVAPAGRRNRQPSLEREGIHGPKLATDHRRSCRGSRSSSCVGVGGWVLTTWLRIKNGYPLETSVGHAAPSRRPTRKSIERIKLLTERECPAPRRDRLGQGPARNHRADRHRPAVRLAREIDALTLDKGGNA